MSRSFMGKLARAMLIAGFALSLAVDAIAAPLANIPQTLTQPNGTVVQCLASGDENYHWLHDGNGYVIIKNEETGYFVYAALQDGALVPTQYVPGRDNPQAAGLVPDIRPTQPAPQYTPSTMDLQSPEIESFTKTPKKGILRNLVIFIRFKDEPEFTEPITYYENKFNFGPDSLFSLIKEMSYGQLSVYTTCVRAASEPGSNIVSYLAPETREYYHNARLGILQTVLIDAVAAAAPYLPADVELDGNNDGYIDNICFIAPGDPIGWAGSVWPHMHWLSAETTSIRGKKLSEYNFQLQGRLDQGALGHELMHSIGHPDQYRYSTRTNISPMGTWDIMCSGRASHTCSYYKSRYTDWIPGIPEIFQSGTYTLDPLGMTGSSGRYAYKIASPFVTDQYFVVEYRNKCGIDSSIPGSGLIVYRVCENNGGGFGKAFGQDQTPDEVYLYRPGGTACYNGGVINETNGEPRDGYFMSGLRDTINSTTDPKCWIFKDNSFVDDGGLRIDSVGSAGSTITFHVDIAPPSRLLTNAPVLWPDSGHDLTAPITVAVGCTDPGAQMHYTLGVNPADPTESDPIIGNTCSITLPVPTEHDDSGWASVYLKVKAFRDGQSSTVTTGYYGWRVCPSIPYLYPDYAEIPYSYTASQTVQLMCTTGNPDHIHYEIGENPSYPTEDSPYVANNECVYVHPPTPTGGTTKLHAVAHNINHVASTMAVGTYVFESPEF